MLDHQVDHHKKLQMECYYSIINYIINNTNMLLIKINNHFINFG